MATTTETEVNEMNGIEEKVPNITEMPKTMDETETENNTNKMDQLKKTTKVVQIENIDGMKPEKPSKSATREVTINADDTPGTSSSTSSSSTSSAMSHSLELAARRRQFMSQPSTVATRRQQAVCVRRAHKSYGPKNNPNVILDGLNMTVPKGSMYVSFILNICHSFISELFD